MTDRRSAFSLLEMLVVVAAVALLSGMTAPGIFGALRKGAVNDSSQAVKLVAEQAQSAAMRTGADVLMDEGGAWGQGLARRFGVRVTPARADAPAQVVLLRGGEAIAPPRSLSGSVDLRRWSAVPAEPVESTETLTLATQEIAWWYDWRTGRPVDAAGRPLSARIRFTVATRDYAIGRRGAAIVQQGLANEVTVFPTTGVVRAQ